MRNPRQPWPILPRVLWKLDLVKKPWRAPNFRGVTKPPSARISRCVMAPDSEPELVHVMREPLANTSLGLHTAVAIAPRPAILCVAVRDTLRYDWRVLPAMERLFPARAPRLVDGQRAPCPHVAGHPPHRVEPANRRPTAKAPKTSRAQPILLENLNHRNGKRISLTVISRHTASRFLSPVVFALRTHSLR
jgi:hypothetical protein